MEIKWPEIMEHNIFGYSKCMICGADDMLHQADTDCCPKNGIEAPVGKNQEWRYFFTL